MAREYKPLEKPPTSAWESRERLKNAHTKMLCKHGKLQPVVDWKYLARVAVLADGCERKL
jgi:hypothetical protein